ncbi:MAG TPA: ribosome-associated translation inhibitor RaiA [Porphyromonadaceae bacterium]|nr:ribosome-associated translation inhibitor RaiA [Porphyromonadaceae bacterium]
MEIRIQSVHFDATEQLKEFAEKKVNKLSRFSEDIMSAEVIFNLVKPESKGNKEVTIKLFTKGNDVVANRTEDSFEKAVDEVCEALQKQIVKNKEKNREA